MKLFATVFALLTLPAAAQQSPNLNPRLQTLKTNYESAISRATAPLTETYQKELEKLKLEFTKSGDTKSALEVDSFLKSTRSLQAPSDTDFRGLTLSKMSLNQFKAWLRTVTITEINSPYSNKYQLVDERIISTRADTAKDREHADATIAVGKLFVPFTSTNATITFNEALTVAEISYSSGGEYLGRISTK